MASEFPAISVSYLGFLVQRRWVEITLGAEDGVARERRSWQGIFHTAAVYPAFRTWRVRLSKV